MKYMMMALSVLFCITVIGQTKKVIFVCEHGAAKSVIAAAYFNKLAEERKLPYKGVCRGTFPDSVLTQGTIDGLKRDNLLDPKLVPQKLIINDTANVERIIFFTEVPADFNTIIKQEDWSSLNNVDSDYSKRKNAIIKRLNILLDSLEKDK